MLNPTITSLLNKIQAHLAQLFINEDPIFYNQLKRNLDSIRHLLDKKETKK